jgi:hypothetical protein
MSWLRCGGRKSGRRCGGRRNGSGRKIGGGRGGGQVGGALCPGLLEEWYLGLCSGSSGRFRRAFIIVSVSSLVYSRTPMIARGWRAGCILLYQYQRILLNVQDNKMNIYL